jgi:site-specific DNA-methyltransferase (adenine-specific)
MKELKLNHIYQGHILDVLKGIPDNSIDCTVSSPPYYKARDYGTEHQVWGGESDCNHVWGEEFIEPLILETGKTGIKNPWMPKATNRDRSLGCYCTICGAWKGELGSEPSPDLFVDHLVTIYDEIKRVLKPSGTAFVNLGDTYTGGNTDTSVIQSKNQLLIPYRFAIKCQEHGWIVRNTLIWYKENVMPSSATDRFTVDYEPIIFMVKSKKYFFKQQFEPIKEITRQRAQYGFYSEKAKDGIHAGMTNDSMYKYSRKLLDGKFKGRNMRTVLRVNTHILQEDHYASFPLALVKLLIDAGCPSKVCPQCGRPFFKIKKEIKTTQRDEGLFEDVSPRFIINYSKEKEDTYIYSCKCGKELVPGVTFDPFFGTGTVGVESLRQHKYFVGAELLPKYVEIAKKRLSPYINQEFLEFEEVENEY